ncbi:GNAT family N-acetyltransferase [Lacticaseibacillus parakribbianus]|uniref:GNAT family N-acetyltransferase n=1 Tax=Lacticaseibacillus parakribbianus TaxID=2970927 RepID=UPI0021CB4D94|nr:GNAT family N-acetyltransferase [Lacticaseibacillus parakribbianus]
MIRPATTSEAAAVAAMYQALTKEMASLAPQVLRPLSVPDPALFRDYSQDPASAVLVATEAAQLQGFALVVTAETGVEPEAVPHRFAYVAALYVAPAARHAGLGRQLMAAVAAWQQAQRLDFIQLDVLGANQAARQFYASLGYATENLTLRKRP